MLIGISKLFMPMFFPKIGLFHVGFQTLRNSLVNAYHHHYMPAQPRQEPQIRGTLEILALFTVFYTLTHMFTRYGPLACITGIANFLDDFRVRLTAGLRNLRRFEPVHIRIEREDTLDWDDVLQLWMEEEDSWWLEETY